jgi:hypothetical protein
MVRMQNQHLRNVLWYLTCLRPGQFYDLLELFRVGGDVPDTNYIFMVRNHLLFDRFATVVLTLISLSVIG